MMVSLMIRRGTVKSFQTLQTVVGVNFMNKIRCHEADKLQLLMNDLELLDYQNFWQLFSVDRQIISALLPSWLHTCLLSSMEDLKRDSISVFRFNKMLFKPQP